MQEEDNLTLIKETEYENNIIIREFKINDDYRNMESIIINGQEITRCWMECPYYGIDGYPGPAMICNHPESKINRYIISHPQCRMGFPNECPLKTILRND